jgi:GNAT superfamily N-acetyltransferase
MSAPQNANVAPGTTAALSVRRAAPADAAIAGPICYEAFSAIGAHHNFAPDLPSPDVATKVLSSMFAHPGFYCVVAEENGRIVGSNCQDERGPIAGIGPITIDPAAQNRGIGRQLMRAVMDHAIERNMPGIRLLQAGFHMRSLSLYTKLGFAVREPIVCMQGAPLQRTLPGYVVRPATLNDLAACEALCRRVHGHERTGELRDAIAPPLKEMPATAMSVGLYNEPAGAYLPSISY